MMTSGGLSIEFTTDALTIELAEDLLPSLDEIGAVLRARTRSDASGREIGTFDATTRPTGTEVDAYLESARDEVMLRLPDAMDPRFVSFARRMIALRTAMYIELSYDPDRTGPDTAYARLLEQFNAGMASLLDALSDRDMGVTRRIASMPVISPTLAPYADDVREAMAPDPWPWP